MLNARQSPILLWMLIAVIAIGGIIGLALTLRSVAPSSPTVILYSSLDGDILRPLLAQFEKESGIRVLLVGDTEATKATGLAQRVLAERTKPAADVFWSSEAIGTARLAREGVLEPYRSPSAEQEQGGWPARVRGGGAKVEAPLWYGLALRPRVIVYNTQRLKPDAAPRSLRELALEALKHRVGIAKPQFGTTRGHLAAIFASEGVDASRDWFASLKAASIRLYDGNASVVRAVGGGEILAGLTDLDDLLEGQRNGWPIALAPQDTPKTGATLGLLDGAILMTPATVALVKGAPHPEQAKQLIEFILSPAVERALAEGPQRCAPARPSLRKTLADRWPAGAVMIDWTTAETRAEAALEMWMLETER